MARPAPGHRGRRARAHRARVLAEHDDGRAQRRDRRSDRGDHPADRAARDPPPRSRRRVRRRDGRPARSSSSLVDQFLAANVAALIALYTLVAYAPRNLAALGFAIALAGTIPFTVRVDDFTSDSKPLTWLVLAAARRARRDARRPPPRPAGTTRAAGRRSPRRRSAHGSPASCTTSSPTRCRS